MEANILLAFGFTIMAGLSTGIGSAIAFFSKKTNKQFISFALGFSAGGMIYVSFVEIIVKARDGLTIHHGDMKGAWFTVLSFFGGVLFMMIIDFLVPSYENPHEAHRVEEMTEEQDPEKKLLRMGLFTAMAIAIHNFPEGLATFAGALKDPAVGIPRAIAIQLRG